MTFILVFAILYGFGVGGCLLAAAIFDWSNKNIIRYAGFVPVLNIFVTIIMVAFLFYLVRDYRKNNKTETKTETVGSSNG